MIIIKTVLLLIILLTIYPSLLFSFTIKGKIVRSDTREPVTTAVVILKKKTNDQVQMVDSYGNFKFEEVGPGIQHIELKAQGYYSETKTLELKSDVIVTYYLVYQSLWMLGEIDVVGEKEKGTVSKNTLTKSDREKSTAAITGDPITILEKLPGVENLSPFTSFGSATKFSVRGGSGNENIALLDNALIPNPYHRVIPDSKFIDDLVGDIVLYKGVLPANYGQAMSSLLSVGMNKGSPGFHGKVNLGLLNFYTTLNGASEDNSLNWLWGIRRTHYDLIIPIILFFTPAAKGVEIQIPSYWDSQGKIEVKINDDIFHIRQTFARYGFHNTASTTNNN